MSHILGCTFANLFGTCLASTKDVPARFRKGISFVTSLQIPTPPRNLSPGITPTHSNNVSDDECDILSIGVYFDTLRTNWLDEDGSHCNEEQELEVMIDKHLAAELTLTLEELDEKDPDWIHKQMRKRQRKVSDLLV